MFSSTCLITDMIMNQSGFIRLAFSFHLLSYVCFYKTASSFNHVSLSKPKLNGPKLKP